MRHVFLLCVHLMVFLTFLNTCVQAEETLEFNNNTSRPIELWIWPHDTSHWKRPPETFAPLQHKSVRFNSGENYYLVFVNDVGEEFPVGDVNITKMLKEHPDYRGVAISECAIKGFKASETQGVCRHRRRCFRLCHRLSNCNQSSEDLGTVTYNVHWLGANQPPIPTAPKPERQAGQ